MRHHETFYDKSPVLKELYEPYYLTSGPLFPKPLIKICLQDDDVISVKKLFPVLKQSACLGDNDAMYLVAVILNNGFLVTADEIQVLLHPIKSHLYQHILFILILVEYSFVFSLCPQGLAYLMMAALDNHRLSFLAIGNKHKYGLDTVPLDLDQAYSQYL